jgi:putative transcriptional regulator
MSKKKYQGHLLVANPSNPKDELEKSVILIVTHTPTLGIGLQINNPHTELSLAKVAENIGLEYSGDEPVYYGGNMNQNKIHVIHSLDWRGLSTVPMTKELGITNDISVLAAIAAGEGPRYFKACSGYWLWDDGRLDIQLDPRNQLEHEPHKWEIVPVTTQNLFKVDPEVQWQTAVEECAKYKINAWL